MSTYVITARDDDAARALLAPALFDGTIECLFAVPDDEVAFLRPDIRQPLRFATDLTIEEAVS
jgi:hypothetical protein